MAPFMRSGVATIPLLAALLIAASTLPANASVGKPVVSQAASPVAIPASLTGDNLRDALVNVPMADSELPAGLSSPGGALVAAAPDAQGAADTSGKQTVAALVTGAGLVGEISYSLFPDKDSAQAQFDRDVMPLLPDDSVTLAQTLLPATSACGALPSSSSAAQTSSCATLTDGVETVATVSSTNAAGSVPSGMAVNLARSALDHLGAVEHMSPSASAIPNPISASSEKIANALFSTPVDSSELPSGFSSVLINAGSITGPVGTSYNLTFGVATPAGAPSGQFTYSIYAAPVGAKSGFNFASGQALQAGASIDSPSGFQFPVACLSGGQPNGAVSCSVLVGPVVVSAQTTDADGARSLAAVAVSQLAHAISVGGG